MKKKDEVKNYEIVYVKLNCGIEVPIKLIVKQDFNRVIALSNEKAMGVVFQYFRKKTGKYINRAYFSGHVSRRLTLNPEYKTVAVCDKEDYWNEEYGKQLAADKMKKKLDKVVEKRINYLTVVLRNLFELFV